MWEPGAGYAAGKGTAMSGAFLFTFPGNFGLLLAREGKSRSRNCLGVEWSSLSRGLIKRRILSTETNRTGRANAAELEEKRREPLLGKNPCLCPNTPSMFVHPRLSQSSPARGGEIEGIKGSKGPWGVWGFPEGQGAFPRAAAWEHPI